MTDQDLDFDVVELTPWTPPAETPSAVREVAFNPRAWLPEDDRLLREFFAADTPIEQLAFVFDRSVGAVRDRMHRLGLRRRSTLPWNALEDEELARRYGAEPAAVIAQDLGRLVSAVYTRAALLGLTEGNPPVWSGWEDAQLRAGYEQGVSLTQLAALIGRPLSGMLSRASKLGLRHPSKPEGWSDQEMARALELAQTGMRYLAIRRQLTAEGFPERSKIGFGMKIRNLGYGRGWGRPWTPEEDDRLRQAYERGDSLRALAAAMNRGRSSLPYRAAELGLQGTHPNPDGFRQGPVWTPEEDQVLRDEFGKTPTRSLAAKLNRKRGGVLQRANVLGLVHGMHKPWTDDHARAVAVAWRIGLPLWDLSAALGRQEAPIAKYATRLGYSLSDPKRPTKPGRTRRNGRTPPALADILAQANEAERAVTAIPLKARGAAAASYPKRGSGR